MVISVVMVVDAMLIESPTPPTSFNAMMLIITPLYPIESLDEYLYHVEVTSIKFVSHIRRHRFRLQPTITAFVLSDELLPWFKTTLNNITWKLDSACVRYRSDPYEPSQCISV